MGDISRHSNDFNLKQELNPNKVSSQKLGVEKKDRPDKLRPEAPSLPDNPGSQAMLPQDIEKIPNSDSAKAGNPEGTPTGKSEGTPACNPEDAPTPILGSPEWARQQWVDVRKRSEVTAKLGQISENPESRADAGDTVDEVTLKNSQEQKILEERQFERSCRLQVDYQQHLQKTRVGF